MRSPKHRLTQATLAVAILAAVLVGPTDGHLGSTVMEDLGAGADPAAADGDNHGRVPGGLGPTHTSWGDPCSGVPDEVTLSIPIPEVYWEWWPPPPGLRVRFEIRDYLVFDAAHACSHHDDCYVHKRVHTRNGDVSVPHNEDGRARCDGQFHDDMYEACAHHSDVTWACETVAYFYWLGVRGFGTESWENSSPCTSWQGVMDDLVSHLSDLVGQPSSSATGGLLARALADFFSEVLNSGHPNVDHCEPWHWRPGDFHDLPNYAIA